MVLFWLSFASATALSWSYCNAAEIDNAQAIPHIDGKAREEYRAFLSSAKHRAFAIAPGGAWAWTADEGSADKAIETAVSTCEKYTEWPCVPFAVNKEVVFDSENWPKLWRPYLPEAEADQVSAGNRRGQRLSDIVFHDASGNSVSLSDFRGKVVLLHFWGTWCTYCLPEITELEALHDSLRQDVPDIEFVLLQVREPFVVTQKWTEQHGITLPIYDSGYAADGENELKLTDGASLEDRELARFFPTTYVLDKYGVVVFSHTGPILDWLEYAPFISDVVEHSGH